MTTQPTVSPILALGDRVRFFDHSVEWRGRVIDMRPGCALIKSGRFRMWISLNRLMPVTP